MKNIFIGLFIICMLPLFGIFGIIMVASGGENDISGGTGTNSDIVKVAKEIAWPEANYDLTGHNVGCETGKPNNLKPEYGEAKVKAMSKTPDGLDLYCSCDRFVATVIKNTVDPAFPWGSTEATYIHMLTTPTWKKIEAKTVEEIEPGDVINTATNGHIFIALNTKDRAQASYMGRTGEIMPLGLSVVSPGVFSDGFYSNYNIFRFTKG